MSNALQRDLARLVARIEREDGPRAAADPYRQRFHLMPPVGWLNDPNGLCQFQGIYHAFFQYSPFNAEGGVKMWGHYTSKDMIKWEYQGTALYPDQPFDCHGVYSGSAFIEDGKMYLYYTGNVKLEDGEYDYIRIGREGNTVLVITEDGKTFGKKKELMRNSDYPDDLTCTFTDADFRVLVTGPASRVDALAESSVEATVDLSGLAAGEYTLPITVDTELYPGMALEFEPASVNVRLDDTSGME